MIPASRSATAPSWATSWSLNVRGSSVWTLRTPTVWSCQVSGTDSIDATKRRWSMPRTHRKRGSAWTSGMTSGSRVGGDPPGHALAERHARPADLEPVEAVGRGQRQVRSVAVEQVERGDIRVEHVPGPVDDGLEQLVPRPRRRREAGDLVEEAELLELVVGGARAASAPSRLGRGWRVAAALERTSSRPSRYKPRERLRPGRLRSGGGLVAERSAPRAARRERAAASTAGRHARGRRRAARDRDRRRARPARASRSGCSARCSARSSPSRPARSCSRPSSASGAGRSPSAATTTRPSGRDSTTSCGRSTSTAPRPSSGRSRSTSGSSTWPRRAAGSGRCAGASGRRATASWTDSLADAVAGLRRLGRTDAELDALVGRLVGHAGPHRPPDRGAPADDARRAPPLRRSCSRASTTRA